MTSREIVVKAINHQPTNRVPFDIGATAASGINAFSYIKLREKLGLNNSDVKVIDIFGMLARVDLDVMEALGIDIVLAPSLKPRFGLSINRWKEQTFWNNIKVFIPYEAETVINGDESLLLLANGRVVGKMPKNGYYFSEIANSTMGDIGQLDGPIDPDKARFENSFTDEEIEFRYKTTKDLYNNTDKAIVIDYTDNIRWDTSIPNWLYSMAAYTERTNQLHEKKSYAILERVKLLAQAIGKYAQIFAIYQDWGTQRGELVSPDMFKELVMPHYKRIFNWIHDNTTWKVLFHSCGSISKIIPYMIEMGVDILNPVQCEAFCMDPKYLKKTFGNKLVFWGGGVDTQNVLNYGSKEEVYNQVKERISILGEGGGYVFAPTQDIQPDVPVENICAMAKAVKSFDKYN